MKWSVLCIGLRTKNGAILLGIGVWCDGRELNLGPKFLELGHWGGVLMTSYPNKLIPGGSQKIWKNYLIFDTPFVSKVFKNSNIWFGGFLKKLKLNIRPTWVLTKHKTNKFLMALILFAKEMRWYLYTYYHGILSKGPSRSALRSHKVLNRLFVRVYTTGANLWVLALRTNRWRDGWMKGWMTWANLLVVALRINGWRDGWMKGWMMTWANLQVLALRTNGWWDGWTEG
jgi:hypothetical protein